MLPRDDLIIFILRPPEWFRIGKVRKSVNESKSLKCVQQIRGWGADHFTSYLANVENHGWTHALMTSWLLGLLSEPKTVMTHDGHISDLAWLHVSPHLAAQAVSWIGACTEHRLRVWPHPTSGGPHPCPGIIWTFTLDCSHTLKRMEIEMETGWCILLYLLST